MTRRSAAGAGRSAAGAGTARRRGRTPFRVLPTLALFAGLPALVLTLGSGGSLPAAAQAGLPEGFVATPVAALEFPVGMAFTPSGDHLYVNERAGRIRVLERGELRPEPVAEIETTTRGEAGLLGLALHPAFEQGEPWIYVFATDPSGRFDRVERLREVAPGEVERETIIAELPGGAAPYHHGGIIAFGPDGMLYVSHGEAHDPARAQDPRVLGGKIYRLHPDGSIPPDNPFSGSPTWAYGIRNTFGLAFDPATGNLWASENGPEDHDELNLIVRGGNYGWPAVKGAAGDPRFVDPVIDYVETIAPTGVAFGGDGFPPEARGDLFLAAWAERSIRRIVLDAGRTDAASDEVFARFDAGVVALASGPDGLYAALPDGVMRIAPEDPPAAPSPTPTPETTPTDEPAPPVAGTQPAADGRILWWAAAAGIAALLVIVGFASRRMRGRTGPPTGPG